MKKTTLINYSQRERDKFTNFGIDDENFYFFFKTNSGPMRKLMIEILYMHTPMTEKSRSPAFG